nr:hypothetical protein [Tanacetum cinerariifolium]
MFRYNLGHRLRRRWWRRCRWCRYVNLWSMDQCWNGSNGSGANNCGNKVSGIVQKIIRRCGSGFGRGKRKHRFIKGYMTRNNDFIGVKIKATIAKMIGIMSQKYGRCGTWSKFVICIYMWNKMKHVLGMRFDHPEQLKMCLENYEYKKRVEVEGQGVVEVVLVVGVKGVQLWVKAMQLWEVKAMMVWVKVVELVGCLKEAWEGVREAKEEITEDEIRKHLEHEYMEEIL